MCLCVRAGGVDQGLLKIPSHNVAGIPVRRCSVCTETTHTLLGTQVTSGSLKLAKWECYWIVVKPSLLRNSLKNKKKSVHAQYRLNCKAILDEQLVESSGTEDQLYVHDSVHVHTMEVKWEVGLLSCFLMCKWRASSMALRYRICLVCQGSRSIPSTMGEVWNNCGQLDDSLLCV